MKWFSKRRMPSTESNGNLPHSGGRPHPWAWTKLAQSPGSYASAMWLMQDGSVLANLGGSTKLMALYPDSKGSYINGSWVDAGDFLLIKNNFASAVLSDGRLVACGGEQSGPGLPNTETNFCEIYDPQTGVSTKLEPPPGWGSIGDSPSVVLNDGAFMLGNTNGFGDHVALLNPKTLTWTFGGGDGGVEQGYTLLQTGDVLRAGDADLTSQRYNQTLNAFVYDASLPVMLGTGGNDDEIGPGITLMDGRVVWFGATGHTCIYTPGGAGVNGAWTQASDMPMLNGEQLVTNDSCAILEPNGRVFVVSWGPKSGVVFLEYDPSADTYAIIPNSPATGNREATKMLLLPNGHGLVATVLNDKSAGWYEVSFDQSHDPSWAPSITSFPSLIVSNAPESLEGTQLCGLSECQAFGDDNQQAEHYPMVRFRDTATNDVFYARAHDVSTRSIAPKQSGSVMVGLPYNLAPGTYCVEAVAMGIPSPCQTVKVQSLLSPNVLGEVIAATVFGGVAVDGGGWVVVHGVRIPVDPGPFLREWADLRPDVQDALIGLAIGNLAAALHNRDAGQAISGIARRLAMEAASEPRAATTA